jgi:predicted enzyme related to lactoylglutathione lyase
MTEMTRFDPGQFSWVDLMAPDPDAAKAFYGGLFGWGAVDNPTDQGGVYTQFTLRGQNVAGMGEMPPEMKQAGIPPVWNSYVSVDDADVVAARVGALGGQVTMPVMQVMTVGRMAIFSDPEGAAFSIWQAGDHIGAQIVNEPGALCWNELASRDPEAARGFYSKLFGWSYVIDDEGPSPYTEIMLEGSANGGILQMTDAMPADVPAHWVPYFAVERCEQSADRAKELGGRLQVGPTAIPAGTFAVCADPQGGMFCIIELTVAD